MLVSEHGKNTMSVNWRVFFTLMLGFLIPVKIYMTLLWMIDTAKKS
jgi:hypothetical protein